MQRLSLDPEIGLPDDSARGPVELRLAEDIGEFAEIWPRSDFRGKGHCFAYQYADILQVWCDTIGKARGVRPLFVAVLNSAGKPAMLIPLGIERNREVPSPRLSRWRGLRLQHARDIPARGGLESSDRRSTLARFGPPPAVLRCRRLRQDARCGRRSFQPIDASGGERPPGFRPRGDVVRIMGRFRGQTPAPAPYAQAATPPAGGRGQADVRNSERFRRDARRSWRR